MKRTCGCHVRAVRTFMAREPVAAAASPPPPQQQQCSGTTNTSADRARRVSAALLRARQARQAAGSSSNSSNSSNNRPVLPPAAAPAPLASSSPAAARAEALRGCAAEFGRAAYAVHLAHQPRYHAYGAADLAGKVGEDWLALEPAQRQMWVQATPQGRKTLRLLLDDSRAAGEGEGEEEGETEALPLHPRVTEWKRRYDSRVVVRRKPTAASVAPSPSLFNTPREFINDSLLRFAAPPPPSASSSSSSSISAATGTAAAGVNSGAPAVKLAAKTQEVTGMVQQALWWRHVNTLLGPAGAEAFIGPVKAKQSVAEAHDSPDPVEHRRGNNDNDGGGETAAFSDALLAYCSGVGIGSPRKVYVMQKLLPQLEGPGADKSLAQVKALASEYSREYDAHEAELRNAAKEEALEGYRRDLLHGELTRMEEKLARLQAQLPQLIDTVQSMSD